jgi:hypothetical protein
MFAKGPGDIFNLQKTRGYFVGGFSSPLEIKSSLSKGNATNPMS